MADARFGRGRAGARGCRTAVALEALQHVEKRRRLLEAAVARAWDDPTPPAELARRLQQGKLGEVVLRSMTLFRTGAAGNHQDLTEALSTLRAIGLEDTARRAAIELLILEDEGVLR